MTRGSGLGPGREFDLIARLIAGLEPCRADAATAAISAPHVELGPGDDAAVLEGGWVLTTDMSFEDVHFRRSWMSAGDIGGRAVRGALSDLAAMAAAPIGVLVSLAGSPADHHDGVLEAVGLGARAAAAACGATLLGGDISRSSGPLVIDVTAVGQTPHPIRRSTARPGDDVWVTGTLGAAALAVRLLSEGQPTSEGVFERFCRPQPRLAEAAWLAQTGHVHALMDLSDGLSSDAGHIAAASAVHLRLDADLVPVHEALGDAAVDPVTLAISGGEDYELLLTADPALRSVAADFDARFPGVGLHRIGTVEVGGPQVDFVRHGRPWSPPSGFDHFSSTRA
jgi:thiamine-monophosphate kinase